MDRLNFLEKLTRRGILVAAIVCLSFVSTSVTAQDLKIKNSSKLIAKTAGLTGLKSIVVMDAETGEVLDSYKSSKQLPPASVLKAATAVYALSILGPETTFKTRIIATGPISDGVIKGDLILEGSGDPRLDTDALGVLAEKLKARGVTAVKGKFYVYSGALPYQYEVDSDQPTMLGITRQLTALT